MEELRSELQAIGYGFTYDGSARAPLPTFERSLPGLWTLTEPALEGNASPDDPGLEAFTLQLIDDGSGRVQVVFAGSSIDGGDGELDTIATTLMEIESRLPEGNGLDEVVWFVGNKWQDESEPVAAPCVYRESEGAVMLAWFGGEDEDITSFFGTVGTSAVLPDELELCKQALAQAPALETSETSGDGAAEPSVDYSVPPEEAVGIIEAGTHMVIDVRTPAEYEQAHVVGAINIDVEAPDFGARIAELDPDERYLLYCRTGRRSDLAAQRMAAAGFSDITDAAGLADLARAGAPVE